MLGKLGQTLLLTATAVSLFSPSAFAKPKVSAVQRKAMIKSVGVPLNPTAIRVDELTHIDKLIFRKPIGQQTTSLTSGKPIKLSAAKQNYLWAIDAQGQLHVAPHSRGPNGAENIGHPMLTGGKPMRLAGEFNYSAKERTWIMTNDSGRRGFDVSVAPSHLEAARALVKAIGVTNLRGRSVKVRSSFMQYMTLDPNLPMSEQHTTPKRNALLKSLGGYVLLAKKGEGKESIPEQHRGSRGKNAWARKARAALGIASSHEANGQRWNGAFGTNAKDLARAQQSRRANTAGGPRYSFLKLRAAKKGAAGKAKVRVGRAR